MAPPTFRQFNRNPVKRALTFSDQPATLITPLSSQSAVQHVTQPTITQPLTPQSPMRQVTPVFYQPSMQQIMPSQPMTGPQANRIQQMNQARMQQMMQRSMQQPQQQQQQNHAPNPNVNQPSMNYIRQHAAPKPKTAYALFLHREELRRRKLHFPRVFATKTQLTEELIVRGQNTIGQCSFEDMMILEWSKGFQKDLQKTMYVKRHQFAQFSTYQRDQMFKKHRDYIMIKHKRKGLKRLQK